MDECVCKIPKDVLLSLARDRAEGAERMVEAASKAPALRTLMAVSRGRPWNHSLVRSSRVGGLRGLWFAGRE